MGNSAEFQLLAVDLDGTLLDPRGELSARTRRAVVEAARRGTRVVLATSRRYVGALPVARELEAVDALILYDGAQVRTYPTGEIVLTKSFPAAIGQRAAELMAEQRLQPIAQHGDESGEYLVVAPAAQRAGWAGVYLESMRDHVRPVALGHVCAGQPDPVRLVAFGPLPRLRRVARLIREKLAVGEESVRDPSDALEGEMMGFATQVLPLGSYGAAELTVFAPGASKGAALTLLAARWGIPLARTMAIGDGVNDISMLRTAGLGVAMGSAARAVRRASNEVTTSNDDDGAALAIERYLLDGVPARSSRGSRAVVGGLTGGMLLTDRRAASE